VQDGTHSLPVTRISLLPDGKLGMLRGGCSSTTAAFCLNLSKKPPWQGRTKSKSRHAKDVADPAILRVGSLLGGHGQFQAGATPSLGKI
jgi:hypothetical protein